MLNNVRCLLRNPAVYLLVLSYSGLCISFVINNMNDLRPVTELWNDLKSITELWNDLRSITALWNDLRPVENYGMTWDLLPMLPWRKAKCSNTFVWVIEEVTINFLMDLKIRPSYVLNCTRWWVTQLLQIVWYLLNRVIWKGQKNTESWRSNQIRYALIQVCSIFCK